MTGDERDDALLAGLRQAAREDREGLGGADVWDGEPVSAEELARLEALASTPEEAQLLREAATPLDDAVLDRMVDAVHQEVAREPVRANPVPPPRSWRWPRLALWLGAPLLAAAIALVLLRPPPDALVLPPYSLDLTAGATTRSGASPAGGPVDLVFGADQRLEILLRPATRVDDAIDLVVWRSRDGHEPVRWSVPAEIAPGGAVRLAVPVDDLRSWGPGVWELAFVLGAEAAIADQPPGPGDHATVLRAAVRLPGAP